MSSQWLNTGARSVGDSRHRSTKQSSRRISNDERHHATSAGMATDPVFADLPLFVRRSTGRSAWDTGQTDHAQNGAARAGRRDAWTNPALLRPATKNVTDSRRAVHALASRGRDRRAARKCLLASVCTQTNSPGCSIRSLRQSTRCLEIRSTAVGRMRQSPPNLASRHRHDAVASGPVPTVRNAPSVTYGMRPVARIFAAIVSRHAASSGGQ